MNKTLKSILDMCEKEDLILTTFKMQEDNYGELAIDAQFIQNNNGVKYESKESSEEERKLKSTRFEAIDFAFDNCAQVAKVGSIYYVIVDGHKIDLFKWYTKATNNEVDLSK